MKLAVLAMTPGGIALANRIARAADADIFLRMEGSAPLGTAFTCPLFQKVKEIWEQYDGFLFIMATGLVVRTVAPLLRSKALDPAVVVMDEKGRFAISLLSGHLGGANALAERLAGITGAQPVITTATDCNNLPAFDEIARKNGCVLEHPENIKVVSGALLRGEPVFLNSQIEISGLPEDLVVETTLLDLLELPERSPVVLITCLDDRAEGSLYAKVLQRHCTLILRPRNLVLGSGCKKGISVEEYEEKVSDFLRRQGFSPWSLKAVASIDRKQEEPCLRGFAHQYGAAFQTFTPEAIHLVEHMFSQSDFVRRTVGVGNVADCCCALCAGEPPVVEKTDLGGITAALAITKERLIL